MAASTVRRAVLWTAGAVLSPGAVLAQAGPAAAQAVLTVDHYVRHASTVPAIAGQTTQIYVRERVAAGAALRAAVPAGRVVLFVHGAGTPAEVVFDVPYADYSWMAYLAEAGFDTFAMDMTGYGRSTRPHPMNDPCNLSAAQQAELPGLLASACEPSYPRELTTIASDWDDLDAVVDYVRALRRVERVSLIGWSLGGPRAGGYAARHPDKVARLVLLAPAYTRALPSEPPAKVPADGAAMNKQSRDDFRSAWEAQVGCPDQFDPAARDAVWTEMLRSDPVGATWGPGVRRAPGTTVWGWNAQAVAKTRTPALLVAGVHDNRVVPERVRDLYEDLGSERKVLIDLGCSSHNAMWERNHLLLFRASLEWLRGGSVNGMERGVLRLGY